MAREYRGPEHRKAENKEEREKYDRLGGALGRAVVTALQADQERRKQEAEAEAEEAKKKKAEEDKKKKPDTWPL